MQGIRDSYFHLLVAATWAVLAGCVMEGIEVFLDVKEALTEKGLIPLAVSHPSWVIILSAVGWFLIVGGIVGEGIFESLVNSADGSLQTLSDMENDDARHRADDAAAETVKLGIALLKQQERAANAEAALFALKSKLTPRRMLIEKHKEEIVSRLRAYRGQYVSINWRLPWENAQEFQAEAESAVNALRKIVLDSKDGAGWRNEGNNNPSSARGFVGIAVEVRPNAPSKVKEAAREFRAVLAEFVGSTRLLQVTQETNVLSNSGVANSPGPNLDAINIVVGTHP